MEPEKYGVQETYRFQRVNDWTSERVIRQWFRRFTAAVDEATPVDTVDGKNPAPVEVGTVSHYLQGFVHPRWLAGFLNHRQHDI